MSGIVELDRLLATMEPVLLDERFVFVSLPGASLADTLALEPIASFQEKEGLTLVLNLVAAEAAGLPCEAVFRCISLTVHSSLEAVGLTAAFATALAQRGISANVVAGYFHDHIFVPAADADAAMLGLQQLAVDAAKSAAPSEAPET